MKRDTLIFMLFLIAMMGGLFALPGIIFDFDLLFKAGLIWMVFFGAVMMSAMIYDAVTGK